MNKIICFIILLIIFIVSPPAYSLDRCLDYKTDVRIQHQKYFGPAFPYWYGLGQLKQESCCRATATAFDAGMGIAQFMPKTSQYVQSLMGKSLNPYNPDQAIEMQAFYMARIHNKENFIKGDDKRLWLSYQIYNGGVGTLKKEYLKTKDVIPNWINMKSECTRKTIKLKCGSYLNFCDVNYDYSIKVYRYGNIYSIKNNTIFKYW